MIKLIIMFKQTRAGMSATSRSPLMTLFQVLQSFNLEIRTYCGSVAVTVARSQGPSKGIISTDLGCSTVNDFDLFQTVFKKVVKKLRGPLQ